MAERPIGGVAAAARTDYLVRPLRDRDEIRMLLEPYRAYAAYALGQLEPGLFRQTEWWVARGAHGQALVLHSSGGLGQAVLTLGSVDALEAALQLHSGRRHSFLTCQVHQIDIVRRHYYLAERQSMLRMSVNRESFWPVLGETRRLTGSDVHVVNRLYRADGTPAFYSSANIDEAVYFGAFDGRRLVAVAGTHVVAPNESIAVVGNVFTHPNYRNQGLGKLVTSAVTNELLHKCRDVVLSVNPQNAAGVRAYRRLGYQEACRLIEGAAASRHSTPAAFLRRRLAELRGRPYGAELVRI